MSVSINHSNLAMSLAVRKLHLINYLSSSDDEQVILAMEEVLRQKRIAAYEASLQPMSEEAYLARLDRGLEDIKHGRETSLEDYLKEIEAEENQ